MFYNAPIYAHTYIRVNVRGVMLTSPFSNQDVAIYISHSAYTLGKDMGPTIPPPAMSK